MFEEEDLNRLKTVIKYIKIVQEIYSSQENALKDERVCRPAISWHLQTCQRPLNKVVKKYKQLTEDFGNKYLADFADIVETLEHNYEKFDTIKVETLIVEFFPQLKDKIEHILANPEAYDYKNQIDYYPPETQTRLQQEILDYLREIKPQLEAEGITKLGLYGSFAKGKVHEQSDIDICFCASEDFDKNYRGIKYFGFLRDIEDKISERFGRSVNLCDIAALPEDKKSRFLKGAIYIE